MMQKRKNALFKLLLVILVAAGAYSIAEIALRAKVWYMESSRDAYVSPYSVENRGEYVYRHGFNLDSIRQKNKEFAYVRSSNDLGFTDSRNQCEVWEHSRNGTVILALGDSYTEGYGAQKGWPQLLEQDINPDKRQSGYLIYNAGVCGSDPYFSFQNMRFLLPRFHPAIVIELVNVTDLDDVFIRGGWERFQDDGTMKAKLKKPWWEPWYTRSFLVQTITRDVLKYNHLLVKDSYENINAVALNLILEALDSSRSHASAHHAAFIVAYHPIPVNGVIQPSGRDSVFIHALKTRYGTDFIDLTASVNDENTKDYFWKKDRHCTYEGYKQLASGIHTFLKSTNRNVSQISSSRDIH